MQPSADERRAMISVALAAISHAPSAPSLVPLLLKLLGRDPNGSEGLATGDSLRLLAVHGGLLRLGQAQDGKDNRTAKRTSAVLLPPATEDDNEDEVRERQENGVDGLDECSLLPHELELLRCLCNALMLHPQAREDWPDVLDDEQGYMCLKGMSRMLRSRETGFLGGRLLFLLTSRPSKLVPVIISDSVTIANMREYAIRYINTLNDKAQAATLSKGATPTHSDTLKEHLKMAYNLMLQFTRHATSSATPVQGQKDTTAQRQSHTSEATTESSDSTPSSKNSRPRLKRILSGLSAKSGNGPSGEASHKVTSPTRESFDGPPPDARSGNEDKSDGNKPFISTAKKLVDAVKGSTGRPASPAPRTMACGVSTAEDKDESVAREAGALSLSQVRPLLPLFKPYLHLCCLLNIGDDPKDLSPLLRSAINSLLNFPVEVEELDGFDHSWMQPVPGSEDAIDFTVVPRRSGLPQAPPLLARLIQILHVICEAWFPAYARPESSQLSKDEVGEPPYAPDDLIPRDETSKVEEILSPVLLLLRKVTLLAEPAFLLKEALLPIDIDRSIPLDRRPDLIGHLIRLTSSIMLSNSAYGAAEVIYNLCERDPERLSQQIGYGNAAGLLQNRGELIPPPPPDERASSSTTTPTQSDSRSRQTSAADLSSPPKPINPITGAYDNPSSRDELAHMTDEEKEREAEKLYVLFDRMNRTGVVSTLENPVDKAKQEGKLESTKADLDAEKSRLDREDEETERQVQQELAQYKAKKAAKAV
ncbi:hypothetical protein OIV83_001186 [Microbotryomycetes sp. JL201]|nr:hypothetical protein OIV83_001186 [Microbotryomycetes sp. JL201]